MWELCFDLACVCLAYLAGWAVVCTARDNARAALLDQREYLESRRAKP